MQTLDTTKMTTKGQVVIPERIRKAMKLSAGNQFVVVAQNDVLIFKTITPPALDEFKELIKKVRTQARAAGMKRSDIHDAIKAARA
jgi:AbrB family looped-hinge helix DNA binding protein